MSVKCQETLVPVHVESTSRWYIARGSIAPGIPHQQEAQEQELLRIALDSGGTRTGDIKMNPAGITSLSTRN